MFKTSMIVIKSHMVLSLVWRICVLKVTVLIIIFFFTALQLQTCSSLQLFVLWWDHVVCCPVDSARINNSTDTETKPKRWAGKATANQEVKELMWVYLSKRDKRGYSRRIGSQTASLMVIKLHTSATGKQKRFLWLSPTSLPSGGDRWELAAAFLQKVTVRFSRITPTLKTNEHSWAALRGTVVMIQV